MECPKCGGPMWDNRQSKRNPKAPDFKCKDRDNCDGAVWQKKATPASTNGSRGNSAPAGAKDEYWLKKDAREAAKEPVITAMHSQDMALEYFKLTGKPPTGLKDVAAMTDWFFKNAMSYQKAPRKQEPEQEQEPDYAPSGADDDSGLDL